MTVYTPNSNEIEISKDLVLQSESRNNTIVDGKSEELFAGDVLTFPTTLKFVRTKFTPTNGKSKGTELHYDSVILVRNEKEIKISLAKLAKKDAYNNSISSDIVKAGGLEKLFEAKARLTVEKLTCQMPTFKDETNPETKEIKTVRGENVQSIVDRFKVS